jgi:hypothetical protein
MCINISLKDIWSSSNYKSIYNCLQVVIKVPAYALDISVMLTPCFGDIDPPCSKWFKEQTA